MKKEINSNISSSLVIEEEKCVDFPSHKVDTTLGIIFNKPFIHDSNNVNSKSFVLLKQKVNQVSNKTNNKNPNTGKHFHKNIDVSISSKGNSSRKPSQFHPNTSILYHPLGRYVIFV